MYRSWPRQLGTIPFVAVALVGALAACDDDEGPKTSAISATVEQSSFAWPVTQVIATNTAGIKTVTPVAKDGAFQLILDAKHRYTFVLNTDLGTVPLVIDGAHGDYATELQVKSGGARADIGTIRFHNPEVTPNASSDACVDGYFVDSAEPCIAGRAVIACGTRGKRGGQSGEALGIDESAPRSNLAGPVAVPLLSLPTALHCDSGDDDEHGEHDDDDGGPSDDDGPDDDD
jgi:hypothetical protein